MLVNDMPASVIMSDDRIKESVSMFIDNEISMHKKDQSSDDSKETYGGNGNIVIVSTSHTVNRIVNRMNASYVIPIRKLVKHSLSIHEELVLSYDLHDDMGIDAYSRAVSAMGGVSNRVKAILFTYRNLHKRHDNVSMNDMLNAGIGMAKRIILK